jgi:alkanesulfonate monooxygenase SsuD/methylene tetrahydromethanopterin reductase-like flavin-dependent oxidoreductase (luciferase family)
MLSDFFPDPMRCCTYDPSVESIDGSGGCTMAFFGMRFDMRTPAFAPGTSSDRYRQAVEMVSWADRMGFLIAVLSEHHGSADGYLPAPIPMAAAMASRTENIRFTLSALIAPFHDPLRLAEDLAVLDLLSGGRVDVVLANGYVQGEFDMFGVPITDRARLTTETLRTLKAAWTGEPFEFRGRRVQVLPMPAQDGGPRISLGGSVEAAARRAARIADGFVPSTPEIWKYYVEECLALGKPDPGPNLGGDTSVVHVASDVDEGWEQLAPYAMHEVNAYGAWSAAAGLDTQVGYERFEDPDALRASGRYRVMTPQQLVEDIGGRGPFAFTMLHPLVGGFPPELAWRSLELIEREVLPALQ